MSRKHRKFAMDDNNFRNLDKCLARVRRRTVEEVAEANERFLQDALSQTDAVESFEDEDESMLPQLGDSADEGADDVRWEEWVDADKCEVVV